MMQLSHFIQPVDRSALTAHLLIIGRLLAAILLPPLAAALLFGEFKLAAIFAGLAAAAWLIGRLRPEPWPPEPSFRDALVITALAYLLFALIGAVPYCTVAPFVDGLFESMSGFTTTGLSVLDPHLLPRSLLFFRAYSQWIGGAGIIVLSLMVLIGPGRAAFTLYASEFGRDNLAGSVIATARVVMTIYVSLTALGLAAFLLAGMDFFDALLHVLATLSTGGFSPHSASIGVYGPAAPIRLAVTLFMLLGAISFPLYYLARIEGIGRFRRDAQLHALLLLAAGGGLTAWWLAGHGPHEAGRWLFEMVSALTTTGFNLTPPASWPESVKLLAIGLMIVGGTAGSTAGGIKLFRLILALKLAGRMLVRTLLPAEAKIATKLDGVVVADEEFLQIGALISLYGLILAVSTLALILGGYPALDSLFESASALGTVGLSTGITNAAMAGPVKLLFIFDMWAGRLEIIPVLTALSPGIWRHSRRTT